MQNTVFKLQNGIGPGYICEIGMYSSPLLVVTEIWKKKFFHWKWLKMTSVWGDQKNKMSLF